MKNLWGSRLLPGKTGLLDSENLTSTRINRTHNSLDDRSEHFVLYRYKAVCAKPALLLIHVLLLCQWCFLKVSHGNQTN